MQTIVTPTDFSDISLNAVHYAADMALALNTNLVVLHANESLVTANEFYNEAKDDMVQAEEKLNSLETDLIKRTNGKIRISARQINGSIENEIVKMCSYTNPVAVVMATKGASAMRLFVESLTVYLSRNLKSPVIAVPDDMHYKPVNKILLATDLEHLYDLPVDAIINIATLLNAHVDIVHVYENEDKFEVMTSRIAELTAYLKKLNSQFHFINNTNVYDGIMEFAKQHNSDMILTFPKKHAFFHKSKSKQLLFNSPFAVMTMQ